MQKLDEDSVALVTPKKNDKWLLYGLCVLLGLISVGLWVFTIRLLVNDQQEIENLRAMTVRLEALMSLQIESRIDTVSETDTRALRMKREANCTCQGPKGETGPPGPMGPPGLKGDPGKTGLKGLRGFRGLKGTVGSAGMTGVRGPTGDEGPKGEIGLLGIPGDAGATGLKGDPGLQGAKGSTGEKGEIGPVGATGLPGAPGLVGLPGAVGPNGATGQKGDQGPPGITGEKGGLDVSNELYKDCQDAFEKGSSENGIFKINPDGGTDFQAFCQFDSRSGWTVIQSRLDGSTDFYRGWEDYVKGFGDPNREYWLGLKNINRLTGTNQKLSIFLKSDDGEVRTANYSFFIMGEQTDKYRLMLGGYSGDAGDSLSINNNYRYFSTYDSDNDSDDISNCALLHQGAWWYGSCGDSNLNGIWVNGTSGQGYGAFWNSWKGSGYSYQTIYMSVSRF